jgi:hypothetical protein
MSHLTKRQVCNILAGQIEQERATFMSHWRDLADYMLPRRGRFYLSDNNRGDKRNQNIIDSTATMAARTLRSGMMAGVTSPARPWFKLGFADQEVAELPAVKQWLNTVETRMRNVFARSNLYKVLPIIYGDMGVFGTGCLYIEEDAEHVFSVESFPVGSYGFSCDRKGRPRVWYRDFEMTVRQIVEDFGMIAGTNEIDWSNISVSVKQMWEAKTTEAKVQVRHIVKPNEFHDPRRPQSKFKKFASYYYEAGSEDEKFLEEKGYDYFPVLIPRWELTAGDSYATSCPGMIALGDTKQLQLGEKRSAQAIEKQINPPLKGSVALKKAKVSMLPGDITYLSDADLAKGGFGPVHEVRFDIGQLEQKQEQVRQRVRRAFFEDLFLMLAQSDRTQITATEILERKEEKLLALGPVLEQIDQDLLDPLIDIAFTLMDNLQIIPEAPEEIRGMQIKVEYISIMAQAQKLAGIGNIERFVGFAGQLGAIKPEVLDVLDADETLTIYGDLVGAPLKIIRTKDKVEEIRNAAAQAQAQAEAQAQAGAAVEAAKSLSQTSMDSQNALGQLIGN